MSQVGVASTNLHEAFPVTTLTILILSLIPCVLVLLVLNCLFLAYKLLNKSKNMRQNQQQNSEELLLHSCVSTRHRVARITEAPVFLNQGRGMYISRSEPVLPQPVTSSRTSITGDRGMHFLRPDGATGTGLGSLTEPSTILANSAASGCTSRVNRNVIILQNKLCRSAVPFRRFSDSEADTRSDHVPPNSPAVDSQDQHSKLTKSLDLLRRSGTVESPANINDDIGPPPHLFDKVELECEYPLHHHHHHHNSSARMRFSCLNTSLVGPGLDSDFGASAGVSLRIVSADSDDLTDGVVALEWDYYDPCYVQQNSVPVHKPSRPSIHSKQYWV